jgi:hypothetical protein
MMRLLEKEVLWLHPREECVYSLRSMNGFASFAIRNLSMRFIRGVMAMARRRGRVQTVM